MSKTGYKHNLIHAVLGNVVLLIKMLVLLIWKITKRIILGDFNSGVLHVRKYEEMSV